MLFVILYFSVIWVLENGLVKKSISIISKKLMAIGSLFCKLHVMPLRRRSYYTRKLKRWRLDYYPDRESNLLENMFLMTYKMDILLYTCHNPNLGTTTRWTQCGPRKSQNHIACTLAILVFRPHCYNFVCRYMSCIPIQHIASSSPTA